MTKKRLEEILEETKVVEEDLHSTVVKCMIKAVNEALDEAAENLWGHEDSLECEGAILSLKIKK